MKLKTVSQQNNNLLSLSDNKHRSIIPIKLKKIYNVPFSKE